MTDVRPRYQLVGLDCPDPVALATFYSRLTGLDVEPLGDFKPTRSNGLNSTMVNIRRSRSRRSQLRGADVAHRSDSQQLHLDFLVPILTKVSSTR